MFTKEQKEKIIAELKVLKAALIKSEVVNKNVHEQFQKLKTMSQTSSETPQKLIEHVHMVLGEWVVEGSLPTEE